MENKFLSLVSSPIMNLDHTYRYSGTKLVEPESLSQHIVDTIMLGLKMIDEINNIYSINYEFYTGLDELLINPSVYVMKAVYHDMEEIITGDIPRPLKYYNINTLNSMRDVADKVATEFFYTQFHNSNVHYALWNNAKDGKEGFILKIVDTLVVVNKVLKEVSLLNNYYMLRVAHEVSQYLVELKNYIDSYEEIPEKVTEYIKSVVDGAYEVMKNLLEKNKEVMEQFNIYGQSML